MCFQMNIRIELSYMELCKNFDVQPLFHRREISDLTFLNKVFNDKVDCSPIIGCVYFLLRKGLYVMDVVSCSQSAVASTYVRTVRCSLPSDLQMKTLNLTFSLMFLFLNKTPTAITVVHFNFPNRFTVLFYYIYFIHLFLFLLY